MPGLNVLDDDGDLQIFTDANVWHVDDRGQLHLNQNAVPVASFAKDRWQAVAVADTLDKRPFPLDFPDAERVVDLLAKAIERGARRGAQRAGR